MGAVRAFVLGLIVVGCGAVSGSAASGPEVVAEAVVESLANNDVELLQSVAASDFTAPGPDGVSVEPDLAGLVFAGYSMSEESQGTWQVHEVVAGDTPEAASAVIGIYSVREEILSLSIVQRDNAWWLVRVDPIPVDTSADAVRLAVVDHGDRLELAPAAIPAGPFYIEIENRSDRVRACQILDVGDGPSDEELDGLISREDERMRRLRAGLGALGPGLKDVFSFSGDYFEPGELLLLCFDVDGDGWLFAGRRLTITSQYRTRSSPKGRPANP